MVSFQCDGCADTVKKPKLDQHRQRCWASFTCLGAHTAYATGRVADGRLLQDVPEPRIQVRRRLRTVDRRLISRSHTSCISEAEKYQGALYRGPKKGHAQAPPAAAQAAATAITTPLDSAASSPAPPAIHPSRLNQVETAGSDASFGFSARGGPSARGGAYGRGGRGGARGGYGAAPVQSAPPRGRGKLVSGENTRAPESGMRSWGSPAVVDDATESFASTPAVSANGGAAGEDDKKKRKKKGDKGGTGAKANSKRPKEDGAAAAATAAATAITTPVNANVNGSTDAPAQKKRKRSEEPTAPTAVVAATTSAEISDKTLKRLRKNASKVGEKASAALPLSDWLKQVGEGKKEQVEMSDVNRAAKVSFEDGKWVLSF